jgi:hypothetical protein
MEQEEKEEGNNTMSRRTREREDIGRKRRTCNGRREMTNA